jgi:hypothetical protein
MNAAVRVNKHTATLFTFLLSALVHELVMWCIFKKLRGYLLFMQMLQLPVSTQPHLLIPIPPQVPARVYCRSGMLTLFHKACAAEQDEVDEGQEDAGEHQLLAGHIYWAFCPVFPLSDTLRTLSAVGQTVRGSFKEFTSD